MPSEREVSLLLRRFRNTDIATDPAFLADDQLQLSQNWVPDTITFLLTKRRGSVTYFDTAAKMTSVSHIRRVYDTSGNRYLYIAGKSIAAPATDALFVIKNDVTGSFDLTESAAQSGFASSNLRYGSAALGGFLYVGNGTDPDRKSVV